MLDGLTLIRIRRGQDGAVLPLHFLHFFCQRLDKAPDLLHLCEEREREVKVVIALTDTMTETQLWVIIRLEPEEKRPH